MRLIILAILGSVAATPALAVDGAAVFAMQCKSCHALAPKSGPGGPSLKGVFGRKIAGAPDYAYSAGLKAKVGTWSDANLEAYLSAPATFAPGTKMFSKVGQAPVRAALISYLKTVK